MILIKSKTGSEESLRSLLPPGQYIVQEVKHRDVKAMLKFYREELNGYSPRKIPNPLDREDWLTQIRWMITNFDASNYTEAQLLLGQIQGMLVALGVFDLDDLKCHDIFL